MGLSSKQVSSDGLDWNQALLQAQTLELSKAPPPKRQHQQSQQQPEPLKCPRCDSMNTKFCYYNNYNKSQPRHFCKSCKRHWTKGGTLRNVPVGGGRKNKRLKTSNTSTSPKTTTTSTTTTTTNNKVSPHMGIQGQDQRQNAPFSYNISDQRSLPNVLYQRMTHPRPPLLQQNSLSCNNDGGLFLCSSSTSTLPVFPFPSSSPSSFDTNPSSISPSFHSSSVYNFTRGTTTHPTDDPAITSTIMPASTTTTQPWQVLANTTSAMDTANYWNWEDIDTLVSTDLNIPWDDSDIKP